MNIAEMHQDFKILYNKLDSNHIKDFTPFEIDWFINRAINEFIEINYASNNLKPKYKLGFEVTQQKTDMLRTLVKKQVVVGTLVPESCGEYSFPLPEDYVHLVQSSVVTDCCGIINVKPEQHDDLNRVLNSTTRGPSLKWRRLVSTLRSDDIIVYTNNETALSNLNLVYIRKPSRVFLGDYSATATDANFVNYIGTGYDSLEYVSQGTGYKVGDLPVDCDIDEHYHNTIIDLAVQEANRVYNNSINLNMRQDRISSIE